VDSPFTESTVGKAINEVEAPPPCRGRSSTSSIVICPSPNNPTYLRQLYRNAYHLNSTLELAHVNPFGQESRHDVGSQEFNRLWGTGKAERVLGQQIIEQTDALEGRRPRTCGRVIRDQGYLKLVSLRRPTTAIDSTLVALSISCAVPL